MRFRFGECVLDSETHELLREGRAVRVSPKAFHLLSALIEKRPRALSKDELHAALWPKTFVADTTLTSLVKELRAAIGDVADAPRYVRTVPSFGYAFSGDAREVRRPEPGRVRAIALAALAVMLAAVGAGWFLGDRRARRE